MELDKKTIAFYPYPNMKLTILIFLFVFSIGNSEELFNQLHRFDKLTVKYNDKITYYYVGTLDVHRGIVVVYPANGGGEFYMSKKFFYSYCIKTEGKRTK